MGTAQLAHPNSTKNLVRWKPGQSGNPSGKPKIPEALRGIASLTQLETTKLISKYARMTREELEKAVREKNASVLELYIIAVFSKGIENGDPVRLSFLLDRAIGKVPVVKETDEELAMRQELQNLSTQELIRIVKEQIPQLEAAEKE